MKIRGPIRGLQGSFDYAALHAEGAGDGGEDGDDEVDDGLDVLFFHCCDVFNDYTILWWVMVHNLVVEGWLHNRGRRAMDALSRYPFMTVFHWCLLELSHRWNSWCDQPGRSSEYP